MKITEVLSNLNSVSPEQRYDAAKFLAGNQIPNLKHDLTLSYEKETVGYIKKTLGIALSRLQQSGQVDEENGEEVELHHHSSYTQGMSEMASMFLHELESVVGRIAYTGKEEIDDYYNSETRIHVDMLRSVIEAITQIKDITKSKKTEEVNVESFLSDIIYTAFPSHVSNVNLSGNFGINFICDRNLLMLAVTNGIRNALESCKESQKKPEISVRWGETNIDWFISIMDNGMGLSKPIEQLMRKKVTTKENHLGYGLTIIGKAMERLDGHWTLENDAAEGANLILRWNK